MNPSTSNEAGNSLVKVTTLIAIVMAAVMVAAGVYGEVAHRRGQVVQSVAQPVVQPTVATTGYFDPCNVDHWGANLSVQERMQFRKQCEERSVR